MLTSLLVFLVVSTTPGAVVTWTNTAGGNWSVAANWSPPQPPGASDSAVLTNDGTYVVTIDTNPTISGLAIGGQNGHQTVLLTNDFRLTVNGITRVSPKGHLILAGGDLRGSNLLEVSGVVTWTSGALDSTSTVNVETNGQFLVQGASRLSFQGSLTNAGTVRWTSSADLAILGIVHNLRGGLFQAENDQSLQWGIGGTPAVINDGVFRKAAGNGTTLCAVPFLNNGRVETEAGTLTFIAGSVFSSGCSFSGPGTNLMIQGRSGVITLDGLIQSENLVLQGARLTGTNTVLGTLKWESGSIEPDAAVTIGVGGRLLLAGSSTKSLQGALTNAGTIQWTGTGDWAVALVLHNLKEALVEVLNDQALRIGIGGSPVFRNDGVLRKSAGPGKTTCLVPLLNNGTVDCRQGTLILPSGSVFNSGSIFSGAGTNLLSAGVITLNGKVHSDNLVLQGATLDGTGSLDGSLVWLKGAIGADLAFSIPSSGQLVLDGPDLKRFSSSVTNAGTIIWAGSGDIAASGVLHNLAEGVFEIRCDESLLIGIGGAPQFVNDGLLRKRSGTGTNRCAFPFVNRGTIALDVGSFYFGGSFSHSSGTISLGGGSIGAHDALFLDGGTLTGTGFILNDVTSAATIVPQQGSLEIIGNYQQLLAGSLEIELNSSLPSHSPRLSVTRKAELNGRFGLRTADGVVPEPGVTLEVLTFASRHGEFCCWSGLNFLGHGRRFVLVSGVTNLVLVAQDSPEPTSIPLRIVSGPETLVCWPWEFAKHALYCRTNLNASSWTVMPGVTNWWLEPLPLASEKYFQLFEQ